MKAQSAVRSKATINVASRIAGEDIAKGDYVTILTEIIELPSFLWDHCSPSIPYDEPVRLRYLPRTVGTPHRVISVCLPFVYAKHPRGNLIALDIRQQQLVRLDRNNGRSIWKQLRKTAKKKKGKK